MTRWLLWALTAYYLLTGLYLAALPHAFYLNAPGAAATGPFNMHFMRDVGFAFLVSAAAIGYGIATRQKPLMVFGALWLVMHGGFHLVLWAAHGLPLDRAALVDALLVSVPAILTFVLCVRWRVS